MALRTTKEIEYQNPVEFIEHVTGKKVLSWRNSYHRMGQEVFFTDKTMCFVDAGAAIDWKNIEYLRIPDSICVSCGQDAHVSFWNWKGQCTETTKSFWENVRKVFWYRHTKNKS